MSLGLISAGCSAQPPEESGTNLPQRPAEAAASTASKPATGLGLVPLPSPQQVAASVALGRLDPFSDPRPPAAAAPSSAAAGAGGAAATKAGAGRSARPAAAAGSGSASPAPPAVRLPADFIFNGVIASGGHAEAFVQTGSQSGSVQVGDVGGSHKPWLPQGWTVAAIDSQRGSLTLRNGKEEKRLSVTD